LARADRDVYFTVMTSGSLLREIHDYLEGSQWWPEAKLREHQRVQLEELLGFARLHVPFYSTRLASVLKPGGSLDWNRWRDVPILTRREVAENRDSMLARDLPEAHGPTKTFFSSGTTGTPLEITHTALASTFSRAATFRADVWNGVDWSQVFCQWAGDDPAVDKWPHGRDLGPWGPPWEQRSKAGKLLRINRATPPEQVAEFITRTGAAYLNTRSRSCQSVVLEAERRGLPLALKAMLVHSTSVTDAEREDCLRVAGAHIHALYSSKEGLKMAHPCPTGYHYHVNSEIVLLEILDSENEPCAVGKSGSIVITPLFSTAQPLIRYDTGDIGAFGPSCACGRGLPVLARIDGRATQLFRLPDGRRIAPTFPPHARGLIGAHAWQVAQTAPLEFEFRYLRDGNAKARNEPEFRSLVRRWLHPDAVVRLVPIDELPLTAGGKFLEFVCELPADA
jgi:phenylacetate-CoA ligase